MFESDGGIREYVGGYRDWLRQGKQLAETDDPNATAQAAAAAAGSRSKARAKKLSYKDQRELDLLPEAIEKLELDIENLQAEIASPTFYEQDPDTVQSGLNKLKAQETELETMIDRWGELEALSSQLSQVE